MSPAAVLVVAGPDLSGELPEPEATPSRSIHAQAALELLYEAKDHMHLAELDFDPEPLAQARLLLAQAEVELRRYRRC